MKMFINVLLFPKNSVTLQSNRQKKLCEDE